MRRRHFRFILGGALLVLAAPAGWGATTTIPFSAACLVDCAAAGMATDSVVSGTFEVSTDLFEPSAPVALVDFGVAFGGTSIAITKSDAAGYGFTATWGADTTSIENVSFVASGAAGLALPGPFLSIGGGTNLASISGICDDFRCAGTSFSGTPGAARLSAVEYDAAVAPVPLPPTGLLAAAGSLVLAAAAWLQRERRRATRSLASDCS